MVYNTLTDLVLAAACSEAALNGVFADADADGHNVQDLVIYREVSHKLVLPVDVKVILED